VHGVAVEEVHFHEVGAIDSIVDACGAVVALELLGWPRALASPPELGSGFVRAAHGLLPVAAAGGAGAAAGAAGPARRPPRRGRHPHRRGAAGRPVLARAPAAPPAGAGRLRGGDGALADRPNVVRLTLGEAEALPAAPDEPLVVVECKPRRRDRPAGGPGHRAGAGGRALDAWAAPSP